MNERDMSLLQAVGAAVKEQLIAMQTKYDAALAEKSAEISDLREALAVQALQIEDVQRSVPGENTIVQAVLDRIDVPSAPELPDVSRMVSNAVAAIQLPAAPALPDIDAIVKEAVVAEVSGIQLPQPEPLPDIGQMVMDAVSAIPPAKDGEPGTDGKDALQIEIMPCIDAEKSHPRGTYAIHQGGLWRSFQKTTGMNGWECLVDGISAIDISQDNEREFTISAQLASGAVTEKTFSIPVMIYRDIFKEGEKYYAGDSVTWAGSVWYCCEETTDKPGEPGVKAWKLAVKRGRDARSKP
ncbi:phage portal protein [Pantoea sp. BAV 3049]|uniref:phage portal protein n=1 Tax=Pantoea sp. BAV 3049 TaxID=2654188 RepID=UPI00131EC11C|nr:phage portal protein [Pantoea sp. BAV 3049]